MPFLERMHPETECQPSRQHHPHRMVCSDTECDCYLDTDDLQPYSILTCCVCGRDWPCPAKQSHVQQRAGQEQRHARHDRSSPPTGH